MDDIDYGAISWEAFEELCSALWFDEGYAKIEPYGQYRDGGRDAVFFDGDRGELVIFQYKRWTTRMPPSRFQKEVLSAVETVKRLKPTRYILNSALRPSAKHKDWVRDELRNKCDFTVEYWDRSWLDLRLNHRRQDLRRRYFGVGLERHTWTSLLASCEAQVRDAVKRVGSQYMPETYVERRRVEGEFARFVDSAESCFLVVDASGSGKTSLLCHLAEVYSSQLPVLLVPGRRRIGDEGGLAKHVAEELGYAAPKGTRWQHGLDDFVRVLAERGSHGILLIDGISENEDVGLMRLALHDLLRRYGGNGLLKICVTCRDSLWHRFSLDFPVGLVYRPSRLTQGRCQHEAGVSATLGEWSEEEFREALTKYKRHFGTEFRLGRAAAERCHHPLLLRLLCEGYAGQDLGYLDHLPSNRIFESYLEKKARLVAEYCGLFVDPLALFDSLVRLRAALWEDDDSRALPKSSALTLLPGVASREEVYARLVDEGVLQESETDVPSQPFVGFVFDELADYLLFRHFTMGLGASGAPTRSHIAELCHSIGDVSRELAVRRRAERFLELLAANLDDSTLVDYLLEATVRQDLHLFARCAERRLTTPNLPDEAESRARQFATRLLFWYSEILKCGFDTIRAALDPVCGRPRQGMQLGIHVNASPGFREVSYHYELRPESAKAVTWSLSAGYPTIRLSLTSAGSDELFLHDPEKGFMVPIFRDGVHPAYRVLNFDRDSPFPGVSLYAPERIAKWDVWTELVHMVEQRWVQEPYPLVHERAVQLIRELEGFGVHVTDAASVGEQRDRALSAHRPRSGDHIELSERLDRIEAYLCMLPKLPDPTWLPCPDLPGEQDAQATGTAQTWMQYSEDVLREYLARLLRTFVFCYRGLVYANFGGVAARMNLYNQWPFTLLAAVPRTRSFVRLAAVPEATEEDAKLFVNLLPAEDSALAQGIIRVDGKETVEERVVSGLQSSNKMSTNSRPVDVLLPMEQLFGPKALNDLTYNWVKSELAEILSVPFYWLGPSGSGHARAGGQTS